MKYILILISILLVSGCGNDSKSTEVAPPIEEVKTKTLTDSSILVSGSFFACVTIEEGLTCWGGERDGISNIPEELEFGVKDITAGDFHACAITKFNKVVCWGVESFFNFGQANVPFLKNPRFIAAGSVHSCAVDSTGVVCWGLNDRQQSKPPSDLVFPEKLWAGGAFSCVMDEEKLKCWGENYVDIPTETSNLKTLQFSSFLNCALFDSGLACTEATETGSVKLELPTYIQSPDQFGFEKVGWYHMCALENGRVFCWDRYNSKNAFFVPNLINPRELSVGHNHTCVIDDTGVICWNPRTREMWDAVPSELSGLI